MSKKGLLKDANDRPRWGPPGAAKDIRHGSDPVALYDTAHDPRIANLAVDKLKLMAADTGLASGAIQGADMFLHRSAFNKIGMFNDATGVGTPFGCEDIEMATRASLAGFVGALVPFIGVTHHHWRLRDSKETNAVVIAYDYVWGAYYAILLDNGVANV